MRRHLPGPLALELDDPYPDVAAVDRPWLALGMASSVDGATTVDGRSGGLGGVGDRAGFRAVRGLADVVLVGRRTAEVERYGRVRPLAGHAGRRARGQTEHPVLAVVTASGALDPALPLLLEDGPTPLVLTGEDGAAAARRSVGAAADVVVLPTDGTGQLAPRAVRDALVARGLPRIVCEGGPGLAHALLVAGLVDELFVTITPQLVGGPTGLAGPALPVPVPLVLHELRTHGSELLCRYRLLSPSER